MRLNHFRSLRPTCPVCRLHGRDILSLELALAADQTDDDVIEGILRCTNEACRHEYPIIDGIPVIVPQLRELIAGWIDRIRSRRRFSEPLESLLGDCCGPGSGYDDERQRRSSYVWDHWAEFDPREPKSSSDAESPGAIARLLKNGLNLSSRAPQDANAPILDVGCAVGRTTYELAHYFDQLTLGVDLDISMLRLAREIRDTGWVEYPRRRAGVIYDRRRFEVTRNLSQKAMRQIDFWCCDATAMPFPDASFATLASLNLIDCVSSPVDALREFSRSLTGGGQAVIASPYDWSVSATPITAWIGGHSQRGQTRGSPEVLMRSLFRDGHHHQAIKQMTIVGEQEHAAWHVRLHDRSIVHYDSHLMLAEKTPDAHVPSTP